MKKLILTLSITITSYISYAQNVFPPSGNVGIGTTAPQSILDVVGDITLRSTTGTTLDGTAYITSYASNSNRSDISIIPWSALGYGVSASNLNLEGGSKASYFGTGGTVTIKGGLSRNGSNIASGYANVIIQANGGNVGVGTSTPQSALDLAGDLTIRPITGTGANGVAKITTYSSSPFHTDLLITPFETDGYGAAGGSIIIKGSSKPTWSGTGGTVNISGGLSRNGNNNPSGYASVLLQADGGNVGIGTTVPDEKLTVKGKIHSQEVIVDAMATVPDYVFEPDYKLTSLIELKRYVDQNHHLPNIPSAKDIEKNGIQLGDMSMNLLKTIEELSLHVIELSNQLKIQNEKITSLENQIKK